MVLGALRSIVRPLSRALVTRASASSSTSLLAASTEFRFLHPALLRVESPWTQFYSHFSIFAEPNRFDSLTDKRLPKRRPLDKPRSKRGSLRPKGPIAWIKHEEGQPIPQSSPNQGSVKRRNEKKRIRLRLAFIKAEAKKRKAQLQEAKRKKNIKKVERKMAAVAREREWTQRLAELQQLEEEKKKSTA